MTVVRSDGIKLLEPTEPQNPLPVTAIVLAVQRTMAHPAR